MSVDFSDLENVPAALRERAQWLLWRFEEKPGDKKPRKVPYYANGHRRTGKQGDDRDRAQLVSFDQVRAELVVGDWSGVGFAFLPGDGLIGIDLDGVIDPETGAVQERAAGIIKACESFTEFSPSGKGVHIYCLGETTSQKSNEIGVEVFCGRQFFTVTGRRFGDAPAEVAPIAEKVVSRLHEVIETARRKPKTPTARLAQPQQAGGYQRAGRDRIESALAFVSPDLGYSDWIAVGMACYDALGEHAGLAVWDYWSSKGAKYGGTEALMGHWRSFGNRPAGGDAVIFRLATDQGWRPPRQQRPVQTVGVAPVAEEAGAGDPRAEVVSDPEPAGARIELGPDPRFDWRDRLFWRNKGQLQDCRENVYLFLKHHPAWEGVLHADTFARKIVMLKPPPWHRGHFTRGETWTDDNNLRLGMWLAAQESLMVRSIDNLSLAAGWVAREAPYHPVLEYVRSIEWDRRERLSCWLSDYLGVRPSEYAALAGSYFMKSIVARVFKPGDIVRSMPILEGPQFQGKSTVVRILGGQWYSDTPLDLNSKDVYQNIQGVLLYEIAELDAFNKAESTRIKAFISSPKDRFRAPYDRDPADHQRQTVFVGTTNQDEYFKDSTGNTRYWPWKTQVVSSIDLDGLARDRDQLFAEAVWRYEQGERWHPTRDEQERLFEPEQSEREIDDPWQALIERWLRKDVRDRITTVDVLLDCLKIEGGKIDNTRQMSTRVGIVMKRLGWRKGRDSQGTRERFYERPEEWKSGAKPIQAARVQAEDSYVPF